MHVTACLAGQEVDVEVGEDCRTLQALKEAVVKALPQLCVEGFDVSVGGRALDDDEGVVSLVDSVCLDVAANTRALSVLALREAGLEVNEDGLLLAASDGDVSLVTLYLDAGVPIDCVGAGHGTPLHLSCRHALPLGNEHLSVATLLLDRGSRAIDQIDGSGLTPLHLACNNEHLKLATLLLDRGSRAIDAKVGHGYTPLHIACLRGHVSLARLLLDRGSRAIDEKNGDGNTPLHVACRHGHVSPARLLLDRGCNFDVEDHKYTPYSEEVLQLLSERHAVQSRTDDTSLERAKRRRTGE